MAACPVEEDRLDRHRDEAVAAGALLGTFAGDAVGARWEGSRPVEGRRAADRIARSLDRGELVYTDDTQLTLALTEHLCDEPTVDPQALARVFIEHHEPWRGYGAGMLRLLDVWRAGTPVEEAATTVFPQGSFGNGAAMRVAPVGVLWADDPERIDEVARRQAATTHAHRLGQAAAALQARAVGLAAAQGRFDVDDLVGLASTVSEPELRQPFDAACELADRWSADGELGLAEVAGRAGNEVIGHRSVPAALWAAAVGEDLEGTIELAVGLGGDADTLAAMAGAIAGAAGTRRAIPAAWLERFEDGARGRAYALGLARRLAAVRDDRRSPSDEIA